MARLPFSLDGLGPRAVAWRRHFCDRRGAGHFSGAKSLNPSDCLWSRVPLSGQCLLRKHLRGEQGHLAVLPRKGWPRDRGAATGKESHWGPGHLSLTLTRAPALSLHQTSPPRGPGPGWGTSLLLFTAPPPGSVFTLLQGGPYVLLASCGPPPPAPSGTRRDDPCPQVCSAPGPESLVPMLGLASRGHRQVPRAALGRTQDAEPRSEAASPQAGRGPGTRGDGPHHTTSRAPDPSPTPSAGHSSHLPSHCPGGR